LRSTAARWLALARSRAADATFPQLTIGLGIIVVTLSHLKMMGPMVKKKICKR
jgi:hypothetical protein